jgi:hypothetical protein
VTDEVGQFEDLGACIFDGDGFLRCHAETLETVARTAREVVIEKRILESCCYK